jgi:outer membrane biosynthesis protein TonB
MINWLRRVSALWASMMVFLFAAATAAYSQAPTDAQRSAIRSQCRSDYEAHCASVPPGGKASLQCLQKNMSSLSSGCQAAVRAVEAPAAPKAESTPAAPKAESTPTAPKAETAPAAPAESAPAASTAKPAAETAAPPAASKPPPAAKAAASTATKKPSSAQVSAIRSACRNDYQQHCAGVPTGGAAALSCLEKNKAKLSANCQKAVSAAGGGAKTPAGDDAAAAPAAGGAPTDAATTAAPAAAPALVLRQMRPREVIFVLRSACGADVRSLCGDVPAGGGRIIECLATKAASLSPACADVLKPFAAQ